MKLTVIVCDCCRVKKSLPEDFRQKPEASFMTALVSASFATAMCYPLDTARRQMQMRGSPFNSFLDAIPGISTELSFADELKRVGYSLSYVTF